MSQKVPSGDMVNRNCTKMKIQAKFYAGASLLTLTACADLGYGEYSLNNLLDGSPGPVQVAELRGTPGGVIQSVPGFEPPIPVIAQQTAVPSTNPVIQMASAVPQQRPVISATGPANAKPGLCYAEFITPAVTKTTTRQVQVSPATTKTETIPAKYKTETVREMVTPATTRTETIPATYKTEIRQVPVDGTAATTTAPATDTVTERVLVKPAETRTVEVPAVFETVTERVKIRDSYTEWKESTKVYAIGAEALGGTILANRVSSSSIMGLVEIPAEFQTVTKRVLVSEATTREETIPAIYETVTREVSSETPAPSANAQTEFKEVEVQVIDRPEDVRVVPVPAEYKTVTKRVLESPAVTRTVPVGAVFRNEASTTIVTPARREWVSVLCDNQATPDFVMAMQTALQGRGLYMGPIDGIIGSLTRRAIRQLQNDKSDLLSLASASELGLKP